MKKNLTTLFLLSVLFLCLSKDGSAKYNTTCNNGGNDSAVLIQLEKNWAIALINKDESIFKSYLAANFIYTENEKLYTRGEVLQSLITSTDVVEDAYNEDMEVHLFGNTAVVTGFLFVNGKGTDGNFNRKYRYTDTWQNSNGEWKIIAAQDYLMP